MCPKNEKMVNLLKYRGHLDEEESKNANKQKPRSPIDLSTVRLATQEAAHADEGPVRSAADV
jgi:hypothetical protein